MLTYEPFSHAAYKIADPNIDYNISIDLFRGTKPICELECYPFDFFEEDGTFGNKEQLRNILINRGAVYNQYAREKKGKKQMFEYTGEALAEKRNTISTDNLIQDASYVDRMTEIFAPRFAQSRSRNNKGSRIIQAAQGRFIIDAEAFLKYGQGELMLGHLAPYLIVNNDVDHFKALSDKVQTKSKHTKPEEWTNDEQDFLALLPPRFLGYSTRNKFWGQFSIQHTKEVETPDSDLFNEKLQLDKKYKKMIRALVDNHASKSEGPNANKGGVRDIIENKGKGLAILLHGPPGVGKTLTAETIAEATGRPLFAVSVAEIGLDSSKAEKNIQQIFELAGTWDAVLLIDEADVFLEIRSQPGDVQRNALVSVLLRVLEYYEGIMVLTTNRINSFDIAVQSRIHLAIRYDDLTQKQKRSIFTENLNKISPASIRDRSKIDDWVEEAGSEANFNGRQIRNIVNAALALARGRKDDKRITKEDLKEVAQVSKDFLEDLARTTKDARDYNEAGRFR